MGIDGYGDAYVGGGLDATVTRAGRTMLISEGQLIERYNQMQRELATAQAQGAALREALQRLRNISDTECDYGRNPDGSCPGDPPYVAECAWCEADRVLAGDAISPAGTDER